MKDGNQKNKKGMQSFWGGSYSGEGTNTYIIRKWRNKMNHKHQGGVLGYESNEEKVF